MSENFNSKVKRSSTEGTAIIAGTLPAPTADNNGREGWLYTKTTGAEKFNYYLWSQGSHAITLGRLHTIYMVASIDTYTNTSSVPFIVVYTKPTGVGDAQPWYHSKIVHAIDSSQIIMLGEKIQLYSHTLPPNAYYGYRQVPLNVVIKDGDALNTEEILYITLHSDSAGANNTQILISDFGFETNHQNKIDIRLKLDGA